MERLKHLLHSENIPYQEQEPLAAHCTFKIGGPADLFVRPETEEQLCRAIALCRECGVKYYLLGNGSNVLFEDAGYRGAVIDLTALKMGVGFLENVYHPGAEQGEVYDAVVAGAGLKLSSLCTVALENSLTGLETDYYDILGVKIPSILIPVMPGRNLAVILETAAINNRQKEMGYNAAKELLAQLGLQDDISL